MKTMATTEHGDRLNGYIEICSDLNKERQEIIDYLLSKMLDEVDPRAWYAIEHVVNYIKSRMEQTDSDIEIVHGWPKIIVAFNKVMVGVYLTDTYQWMPYPEFDCLTETERQRVLNCLNKFEGGQQ